MRKSRFNTNQRSAILSEQGSGKSIEQICRDHQISPATFHKWKAEETNLADESKRRIVQLESENKRLKKMYSELSIDHQILQEGYEFLKKVRAQSKTKP